MTREEAIEFGKMWLELQEDCKDSNTYEFFKMAIEVLQQEPKKANWIRTGDYFTGAYESIDYVKCSCCGEESLEEGNYCPNCGANMEGEI